MCRHLWDGDKLNDFFPCRSVLLTDEYTWTIACSVFEVGCACAASHMLT
jgi:hypothetical protein